MCQKIVEQLNYKITAVVFGLSPTITTVFMIPVDFKSL